MRDERSRLDTARQEGIEQGIEKGIEKDEEQARVRFQAQMELMNSILKLQTQLSLNEPSFETLMNWSNEELMELERRLKSSELVD